MNGSEPDDARQIIERLGLAPHPEGGWYRETWRAASPAGERAAGTAIHFLLEAGQRSHWHRIDATELWLFQAGAPLTLRTALADAGVVEALLGPDVLAGQVTQAVVRPGEWQAAEATFDWSLVACVVVPGFDFAGFEMAPQGWSPPSRG
jgi:predicted cupin superfamily sugar epimerase